MKTLSTTLKELLLNAKLSENELARRTGVSQQIINRILSGENKNPKIATLKPIANYFMISVSQLIAEEPLPPETKLNSQHLGWHEIPLIEWDRVAGIKDKEFFSMPHQMIVVDIEPSNNIFAVKMPDSSMEPKFSVGTLLIFDLNKAPTTGDFVLVSLSNHSLLIRQVYLKTNIAYIKCLNPKYSDYKLTPIEQNYKFLGTLIQSRTDYSIR